MPWDAEQTWAVKHTVNGRAEVVLPYHPVASQEEAKKSFEIRTGIRWAEAERNGATLIKWNIHKVIDRGL